MAVQDVKLLETRDSGTPWTSHGHNQKLAPTLGPTAALVVPTLNQIRQCEYLLCIHVDGFQNLRADLVHQILSDSVCCAIQ